PATFYATVENFADTELPDCQGRFYLDGKALESRSMHLKARADSSVECMITVHEPGFHHLSFQLERDHLTLDDEQWHAFDARQTVQVLLVDGNYVDDPLERATGQLMWVINPARIGGPDERGTVFEPEVVDYKVFNTGRLELDHYECIIFADVEGLSAEMAGSLKNYTMVGGSVVFFMGDGVDLPAWNQRLFTGEGEGLLPARLLSVIGSPEGEDTVDYYRLTLTDPAHPLFALFTDPRYRVLLQVPVFRFVQTEEPAEEVKVIARFTDSLDRSYPAVLEKRLDKGRVIFFAMSATADWSLIPERPALFLPMMHNLLYDLTTRDPGRFNLRIDEAISRSVPAFPETIALLHPSGYREEITDRVEQRSRDRYVLPLSNHPLEEPGPYQLEVDFSLSGQEVREVYTANIDPDEGDLRRFDEGQLQRLFPDAAIRVVDSAVFDDPSFEQGGGKGEFWKPLLIALLALIALESLLSWKFGNYR
ncbi:MAG: hypothetical protein KJ645_12325, partial [Planctomycetes bacterium]|nr:hypothetical protein [Planctomycetota bacterium]